MNEEETKIIKPVPNSGWVCDVLGTGPDGLLYSPPDGHVPNLFWRYMQRILIGNKWYKGKLE